MPTKRNITGGRPQHNRAARAWQRLLPAARGNFSRPVSADAWRSAHRETARGRLLSPGAQLAVALISRAPPRASSGLALPTRSWQHRPWIVRAPVGQPRLAPARQSTAALPDSPPGHASLQCWPPPHARSSLPRPPVAPGHAGRHRAHEPTRVVGRMLEPRRGERQRFGVGCLRQLGTSQLQLPFVDLSRLIWGPHGPSSQDASKRRPGSGGRWCVCRSRWSREPSGPGLGLQWLLRLAPSPERRALPARAGRSGTARRRAYATRPPPSPARCPRCQREFCAASGSCLGRPGAGAQRERSAAGLAITFTPAP